jgi:hypothetical protein
MLRRKIVAAHLAEYYAQARQRLGVVRMWLEQGAIALLRCGKIAGSMPSHGMVQGLSGPLLLRGIFRHAYRLSLWYSSPGLLPMERMRP